MKGIIFSCFDLLHPGHLLMLETANKKCDRLIVALQSDPSLDREEKNKPVQTMFERYMQLASCKYVDEIIPYSSEEDIIPILMHVRPGIRFLGEDYIGRDYTGRNYCIDSDIEIYYVDRSHGYSSTELKERIKSK